MQSQQNFQTIISLQKIMPDEIVHSVWFCKKQLLEEWSCDGCEGFNHYGIWGFRPLTTDAQ